MDVGVEVGQYRVIEHIGRGGMADVWSARDRRLSRTVAIKTIARDITSDSDPVILFEREAQTIAGLEHPHILPIYEFGEFEGQLYIVMRYVSGGSLENVLDRGALAPGEVLRIARAIGQALEYAHDQHVIHLDLKPSNILLDSYQSPYLADFGLAAVLGPEGRAANPGSGTLLYMAPEQLTSDDLDMRADIYSFGLLIFHMLAGDLPFEGQTPLALRQLQAHDTLPDITKVRRGLSPALQTVLRTSTALEPGHRYARMEEMLAALERALAPNYAPAGTSTATMPAVTGSGGAGKTTQGGTAIPSLLNNTNRQERVGGDTLPLDQLISGPLEGLISRPNTVNPNELATDEFGMRDFETQQLSDLASAPIGDLLRRTDTTPRVSPPSTGNLDDLLAGDLLTKTGEVPRVDGESASQPAKAATAERNAPSLPSRDTGEIASLLGGPLEGLISRPARVNAPDVAQTPEEAARREAEDIYSRARRAWARGQGKFVLGVTDFILISDYYQEADRHALELDDAGRQMLLRGALEYDQDVEYWWPRVAAEDDKRWAALHAVRSENAPARTRALRLLVNIPDSTPPQIARLVAQALAAERDTDAQIAALQLLEARARVNGSPTSPTASKELSA